MRELEKVGVLVVSYGARGAAMVDAIHRSLEYKTEIYVVDKQRNPLNSRLATEHVIVGDLNIHDITRFAARRQHKIDFGIIGPEKPIISGLRDVIEKKTNIPLICPTKQFAIEGSKVTQRNLFAQTVPSANPRYRVFDPTETKNREKTRQAVYAWLTELGNKAVVNVGRKCIGRITPGGTTSPRWEKWSWSEPTIITRPAIVVGCRWMNDWGLGPVS